MGTSYRGSAGFWARVDKSGDCWEWRGGSIRGYGVVGVNKRRYQAHRFAYEDVVGPIPEGLHLDHLCRNRICVNPDHLEPVTQAENNRRINAEIVVRGHEAIRVRCPKGHVFAEVGIFVNQKRGNRECMGCRRAVVVDRTYRVCCVACRTEMARGSIARHRRNKHQVLMEL